jgi:hypothetical protein
MLVRRLSRTGRDRLMVRKLETLNAILEEQAAPNPACSG